MKSKKNAIIIAGAVVVAAASAVAVFYALGRNKPQGPSTYSVAAADLTETVNVTGKVKAAAEVDLSFERGGKVSSAPVEVGDSVKRGQILAALDSADAAAALRQAKAGLDSAQIALEKMKRPPEKIDLLTAQDAVAQASEAQDKAADDLQKSKDSAESAIDSAVSVMQSAVSGLKAVLHSADLTPGQDNLDYYADAVRPYSSLADIYRASAENAYQSAKTADEKLAGDYKTAGADDASRQALLSESYAVIQKVTDAVKASAQLLDLYSGKLAEKQIAVPAAETAARAQLASLQAQAEGAFSALGSGERSVKAATDALAASGRTLAEKQEALAKLQAGAEDIDLRAQSARVEQAQAAYDAAANAVAKMSLVAPFDGVVSKKNIEAGEMAAAGAPAVSLVSADRNEIDAFVSEADIARVQAGESAAVTLDTFGGEVFAASVVSVDPAPTVTAGVGAYGVKLHFAKDDARVKTGMTANIAVVTAEKRGVLAVPTSSIITRGSDKFVVAVGAAGKASERKIVTGISAAGKTEVVSGLAAGDLVVAYGSSN